MDQSEFYIPVDSSITDFIQHLYSHPRTILSAKFGDGKSFFLHQLVASEMSNKFKFITIHPVNYQVETNKDIFDLVKRDIFMQMLANDMIADDYEVSKEVAFAYGIQSLTGNIDTDLLSTLTDLFDYSDHKTPAIIASLVTLIKKLESTISARGDSKINQIKQFIDKVGKDVHIGHDVITQIICENIKKWKDDNTDTQVALIFEDMDRLDPAHMFRILNVLSAHMDYGYRFNYQSDENLIGNKFGVDNIIIVLDYRNLESIYHHFYGENADFDGYIHKFTSSNPFYYSFTRDRNKYILSYYAKITGLDVSIVEKFISTDELDKLELRRIHNSTIDIDNQIFANAKNSKSEIVYSKKMLRMYIILRRLGIHKEEIIRRSAALIDDNKQLLKYYSAYVIIRHADFNQRILFKTSNSHTTIFIVSFSELKNDGDAKVDIANYMGVDNRNSAVGARTIAGSLFEFISQ
jgi:hypothetical protein